MKRIVKKLANFLEKQNLSNSDHVKYLAILVRDGQIKLDETVEVKKTRLCVSDILKQAWEIIQGVVSKDALKKLNETCRNILTMLYCTQTELAQT